MVPWGNAAGCVGGRGADTGGDAEGGRVEGAISRLWENIPITDFVVGEIGFGANAGL